MELDRNKVYETLIIQEYVQVVHLWEDKLVQVSIKLPRENYTLKVIDGNLRSLYLNCRWGDFSLTDAVKSVQFDYEDRSAYITLQSKRLRTVKGDWAIEV